MFNESLINVPIWRPPPSIHGGFPPVVSEPSRHAGADQLVLCSKQPLVFEPPANTSLQSLHMTKIEAWHQRNPQEHMGNHGNMQKMCFFHLLPFVPHVFNSSCSSQFGSSLAGTPHFPTTSAGDAPSSRPLTSFTSAMQRWGRSMELDATRA